MANGGECIEFGVRKYTTKGNRHRLEVTPYMRDPRHKILQLFPR